MASFVLCFLVSCHVMLGTCGSLPVCLKTGGRRALRGAESLHYLARQRISYNACDLNTADT